MEPANAEVAAYIGRWRPSSVSPEAAAFARDVIAKAGPAGRERAKNLLWAAGKLADYGLGLGLEPVPEVLLHPSAAERFTRCAPGLSGAARRTLRTNLRFIGRRVVPQLYPADLPLPRERAEAAVRPGGDRRVPRAGGRPAHGGAADARGRAGLPGGGRRADPRRPARRPRHRRGLPVRRRRRRRSAGRAPRAVPVLARYHAPAAGRRPVRRGRPGLRRRRARPPEHDESAWSARWTAGAGCRGWTPPGCARPGWPTAGSCSGLATFMHAAGISCSQRLGDLVAGLEPGGEDAGGPAAGGRPAMIPLAGARRRHRRLRHRAADRGHAARPGPGRGS